MNFDPVARSHFIKIGTLWLAVGDKDRDDRLLQIVGDSELFDELTRGVGMVGKQDDESLCGAQCIYDFLALILPALDLLVKPDVDTARSGSAYEPLRERAVGAAVAQKNIVSHPRSLLRLLIRSSLIPAS